MPRTKPSRPAAFDGFEAAPEGARKKAGTSPEAAFGPPEGALVAPAAQKLLPASSVLPKDTIPTSRQRTATLPETVMCQQSEKVPAVTVYVS